MPPATSRAMSIRRYRRTTALFKFLLSKTMLFTFPTTNRNRLFITNQSPCITTTREHDRFTTTRMPLVTISTTTISGVSQPHLRSAGYQIVCILTTTATTAIPTTVARTTTTGIAVHLSACTTLITRTIVAVRDTIARMATTGMRASNVESMCAEKDTVAPIDIRAVAIATEIVVSATYHFAKEMRT